MTVSTQAKDEEKQQSLCFSSVQMMTPELHILARDRQTGPIPARRL